MIKTKSKILASYAIIVFVLVLGSMIGIYAYNESKVINQNIEHADIVYQQSQVSALPSDVSGAVAAVSGVCTGYELPSQLCNMNIYELQIQTDLTVDDDVIITDAITISGETSVEGFTSGNGILSLATSTGTTILTEAQLLADSMIEVMINTGATASLQLPATSTMTTLLATDSKNRSWLIHNATSSTMALTILKGDGIDLIGVTNADDVIDQTEYSKLECWKKSNTDVACSLTEWLHVD